MNLLRTFIGLFLPRICLNCDKRLSESEYLICSDCFNSIKFLTEICPVCGVPKNETKCITCETNEFIFDKACSAFSYDEILQNLIHEFKYNEMTSIVKLLGKFSHEYLTRFQPFDHIDYIVPVPLHRVKKRSRGFNQSEYIAREISRSMNWKCLPGLIRRKKFTETQTKLNKQQRRINVSMAFKLNQKCDIKGKNILLVDDVFTTGSTVNSISTVLKDAQVKKVYVFTIARAM